MEKRYSQSQHDRKTMDTFEARFEQMAIGVPQH